MGKIILLASFTNLAQVIDPSMVFARSKFPNTLWKMLTMKSLHLVKVRLQKRRTSIGDSLGLCKFFSNGRHATKLIEAIDPLRYDKNRGNLLIHKGP